MDYRMKTRLCTVLVTVKIRNQGKAPNRISTHPVHSPRFQNPLMMRSKQVLSRCGHDMQNGPTIIIRSAFRL